MLKFSFQVGFKPTTLWLTATCSNLTELLKTFFVTQNYLKLYVSLKENGNYAKNDLF